MAKRRLPGTLSPVAQLALVVAISVVAGSLWFLASAIAHRASPAVAQSTAAPVPYGFFRPTDGQWQSLTIARIKATAFADISDADGMIASPDDTTTEVFSPFTGRVTKVFVTVGDNVRKGAPLFSGESTEYPQALNDLAAALQSLDSARVQLRVTEANRARLLRLLRVDGAARKDVEQSQADVASALTAVRNDQTAAALVRSRLGVLGQSAGSNDAPRSSSGRAALRTTVVVRAPIDGIVTQRAVGVGQNLDSAANGASNALLTISDLSPV